MTVLQRCALLLLLALTADRCLARPQQESHNDAGAATARKTSRLANDESANFAPGSWGPIGQALTSGLTIDEAPSRVRIEQSSSGRDARSNDATSSVATPDVATSPVATTPSAATSPVATSPSVATSPLATTPALSNANVTANATSTRGKSPSPLGDAIKMVANQLLQSRGAIDEADVRTPPKKSSQLPKREVTSTSTEESSHGGVAIPVILEEDMERVSTVPKEVTTKKTVTTVKKSPTTESEKKTTVLASTKRPQAITKRPLGNYRNPVTTAPDGITTWVYLSGSSSATVRPSTEAPLSTMSKVPTETTTKRVKVVPVMGLEKANRKPSPLFTSSGTKPFPNRITKKPDEELKEANGAALRKEALVADEVKAKVTKKPEQEIGFRRRPTIGPIETSTYRALPTAYPISTSTVAEETETTEETTEINTEPTSKRPKKKKNKNKRRRRPTKKPATDGTDVESKIDADTKIAKPKPKPMGTRIYNYLAREVMPSVGVGLVGLIGLAGLAGLILYPFGGGTLPIRRNYNEVPQSNYYYYNKKNDKSGGQTEEEVLGKVIAGMNDNSYVTGEHQYPDAGSRNPGSQGDYSRYETDKGQSQGGDYNRYSAGQESKEGDSYLRYDVDQSTKQGEYYGADKVKQEDYNAYKVKPEDYPGYKAKTEEYSGYKVDGKDRDYTRYDAGGRVEKKPVEYEVEIVTREPSTRSELKSPQYSSRTEPRPVYLSNDWGVVKTDVEEVNDANKPEAMMYRGEEEPIYGSPQEQSAPQYSGVSRVGVGQRRNVAVEHGPRSLRVRRQSEAENEIDMELLPGKGDEADVTAQEEATTEKAPTEKEEDVVKADQTTEEIYITSTGAPEVVTKIVPEPTTKVPVVKQEATTNCPPEATTAAEEAITIEAESPDDQTIVGLIRRVAQYKIRLGINFLKQTSQAVSKYLDGFQRRVEEVHNTMKVRHRQPYQ